MKVNMKKYLLWLILAFPFGMMAQVSNPVNVTGTVTPGDCTKFFSQTTIQDAGAPCGTGGSMTWPGGGAGIPNYSGSSTWSTSYSATNPIPANFITNPLNQNTSGTAGGLSGSPSITVSSIIDSGLSAGTSPICPNGSGGAFTTTGCSVGGGMVYPGLGIPKSTGSAWGTSYAVYGSEAGVATAADPGTNLGEPMVGDGSHGIQPLGSVTAGCAQLNSLGVLSSTGSACGGGGNFSATITSPVLGQSIVYNGSVWINATPGVPVDTSNVAIIPATDNVSLVASSTLTTWTGTHTLSSGFVFSGLNLNSSSVTYTPASGVIYPGGGATQLVPPNWFAFVYTNGTNTYMPVLPTIKAFADTSAGGLAETYNGTTGVFGTIALGSLASLTLTGSLPSSSTTGLLNYGTLGYSDSGQILAFQASTNSYIYNAIQNTNTGGSASACWLVANSTTTTSSNYGEFCQNGSGFSGAGALNQPNVVTFDANGYDLVVGTYTANPLHFVYNNGATDAMTINGTGVLIPTGSLGLGASPSTACGSATNCIAFNEAATAGTPTAGQDYFRVDSGAHKFLFSLNNGAEFTSLANYATLPLTLMATQAQDTMVANMTAGSAVPTAVTMPTTAHGVWLGEGTTTAPGITAAGTQYYPLVSGGASADPAFAQLTGAGMANATVTATQLAAQYSKGSCTEVWGGTAASNVLQAGDDAIVNNSCYNDSAVTRTITAVKCRSDYSSNGVTVNPSFGSAGTGTSICSGALTCGNSYAYSSSCSVSNASWTTGTGIDPVQASPDTHSTSIAMIVEYTF